jgi:hypothetical protein
MSYYYRQTYDPQPTDSSNPYARTYNSGYDRLVKGSEATQNYSPYNNVGPTAAAGALAGAGYATYSMGSCANPPCTALGSALGATAGAVAGYYNPRWSYGKKQNRTRQSKRKRRSYIKKHKSRK